MTLKEKKIPDENLPVEKRYGKDYDLESIYTLNKDFTKADRALIKKAYIYAEKMHKGQFRASGDPYFIHVVATAQNLAELGMDGIVVSAGLLHDTIEDTTATADDLKKEFNETIAFLVEGVTKLEHIKYRGMQRHKESLRKLFIASSKDLRVVIIKFADRLHNLRTLDNLPREKQVRIASESLEIYTQLAYRLGISALSKKLGDLSFKYVYPDEYQKVKKILKTRSKENLKVLQQITRSVTKKLIDAKIKGFKITHRVKSILSLWKKLKKKDWDERNIYDIIALRILVPTVADCYQVLGIVHKNFRPMPGRIKDYIAVPKPNGYQSIHTTIFTGQGGVLEVQIRTYQMHQEAEYGAASHLGYKAKTVGVDGVQADKVDWVSKVFSSLKKKKVQEEIKESDKEWMKDLAEHVDDTSDEDFETKLKEDFFSDRIFVFTPIGDVIDLPVGATPVDFAYHVHTQLGENIVGVKINKIFKSLDTPLQNGDIVEIATKKDAKPNIKWLDFVKTSTAKRKIKSFYEKEKKKNNE